MQSASLPGPSISAAPAIQIPLPQQADIIFLREILAVLLFLTMASGSVLLCFFELSSRAQPVQGSKDWRSHRHFNVAGRPC
jgi:hypothetical protein